MNVVLRFDKAFPVVEWLALYKAAGYNASWTERNGVAALTYAYLVTTAWQGSEIVATAMVWSDGVNFAWLDDLAVHPGHRRRGIGSRVVLETVSRLRDAQIPAVQLFPIPGVEPFFARLGFVVQPGATVMDLQ